MKKYSKTLLLVNLFVLFTLVLAACGPADETTPTEVVEVEETEVEQAEETEAAVVEEEEEAEPVVVTYWHTMSDAETAKLDEVIADFESQNPNITIEATRYAYDDFKSAILTALAGEVAPDTARMDIAWVPEFAEEGALMQLDGEMPGFDDIAADTFPGPLSTNYWEGHYYGLPQNTNTQVLLWNRDMFEAGGLTEAPTTMEEFRDYACQLSDAENEVYGYALGGTYFWAPAPVFYAMGGQVVDEDITTASGYINNPESVAAFTMLTEMFNEGCISPNLLGGGVGTSDGLANGMYAMIIDGPWMVDIYNEQYPDFEVNFSLIPSYEGSTSSVVGGEDIVIFYSTPNADAAMIWMEYLMSPEAQLAMAEVGVMTTRVSLIGNEALPEYFDVFLDQLQTAQARVPHPAWSDMDNAINNAFQRMLRGDQTPQEALDQAADEINELLN